MTGIANLNLKVSSFEIGQYPTHKKYEECILPENHPWFPKAGQAVKDLAVALTQENGLVKNFTVLSGHTYPTCVITKEDWPFVVKVCLDEGFSQKSARQVVIGAQMKAFVQEHSLQDSIYVQDRFLLPKQVLEETESELFLDRSYAIVEEKVKLANEEELKEKCGHSATFEKAMAEGKITPDEAAEMQSHYPAVVWSKLTDVQQLARKTDCAYMIGMFSVENASKSTVRLTQDGRFSFLNLKHSMLLDPNYGEIAFFTRETMRKERSLEGLKSFLINSFTSFTLSTNTNQAVYDECAKGVKEASPKNIENFKSSHQTVK